MSAKSDSTVPSHSPEPNATAPINVAPFVAFIFTLVTFQGLTINLMPVVLGTVADAFSVKLFGEQGSLQTMFLAGGIFSLFVSGYVTEYVRPVRSALFAVLAIAAGLILLGCAASYRQVLAAAVLIGVGNFWMLAPYSAVITERFIQTRRSMFMWATAAFAFSAMVGNLVIGFLLSRIDAWQSIFVVIGAAIACWFGGLLWFTGDSLGVLGRRAPPDTAKESRKTGAPASLWQLGTSYLSSGLFNRWALWVLGFLVVLDNLAGGNMVAWTARFFQLEYHIGEDKVGAMLSASAAGVFVGRLLLGTFVSGRYSDLTVLGACYAGAVVTYGALLLTTNYYVGVILLFLSGALMSAQAPTMYSIASARFGSRAATAIPLIDAIGVLGSFMGPRLLGELADQADLRSALWIIPATGVVFVAVVVCWEILDQFRRPAAFPPSKSVH